MRAPNKTYLDKKITKSPSHQGSHGLGDQRFVIQSLVVRGPSWNSSSSDTLGVAEKRAGGGSVLSEGGLLEGSRALGHSLGWRDTKGANSKERGCYEESGELHGTFFTKPMQLGR